MPFTMSQASLPVFEIGLNALTAVLDKAAAHAAAKKIDAVGDARLAPGAGYVRARPPGAGDGDQAKNGAARLAGVEPPKFEDNETTIDQLKERIAKTVAFLKTLDTKAIDASADREITFPLGPSQGPDEGRRLSQSFRAAEFLFPPHRRLRDRARLRRGARQARLPGRHPDQADLIQCRRQSGISRGASGRPESPPCFQNKTAPPVSRRGGFVRDVGRV